MNSKLLLCGIIASTFLTVSCQKKGARPPLAAAAAQTETTTPEAEAPKIPEAGQVQLPPITTPQKVETTDQKKDDAASDKKDDKSATTTEHKDEAKKDDTTVKTTEDTKKEGKETVVVKTEEKKDTATTKEKVKENINQEKAPDKKEAKDDKQAKASVCTDYLAQKIDDLGSIEVELKKEKDQTKSVDLMKSYIKSCGDFFRSINNHNDKSCVLKIKDKTTTVNETLFTERCNYVGYQLEQAGVKNLYAKKHQASVKAQIEKMKASYYVLTDDTQALLKKENNDFKMFILNGEIKTDEALTKDSKNIACSFTATDISIIPGNSVVAKVKSIESADINTEKRALLKLTLTSQDKDIVDGLPADHKLSMSASLVCKNLNVEHFNLTQFEKSVEKFFTKK